MLSLSVKLLVSTFYLCSIDCNLGKEGAIEKNKELHTCKKV